MSEYISFVRLERPNTRSLLTCQLPMPMRSEEADWWVQDFLPGWEVIMYCPENPDKVG